MIRPLRPKQFFREARQIYPQPPNKESPMRFITLSARATAFTGSDRFFARCERATGTGGGA